MPIIRLNNPLPGIGYIEIFSPQIKDDDSILFFLKINERIASIELKGNDTWKTHGIYGHFPSNIVPLIQQEITEKYLGGL
jgi:hypothetical protein